jgi:hypothetical protein
MSLYHLVSATCQIKSVVTLIFAIATLNLLMDAFLDLLFENSRSCRFIIAGNLQNVGGIDPVVGSSSHDMVGRKFQLVDWNLQENVSKRTYSTTLHS